jgi:hypothetical protein
MYDKLTITQINAYFLKVPGKRICGKSEPFDLISAHKEILELLLRVLYCHLNFTGSSTVHTHIFLREMGEQKCKQLPQNQSARRF